MCVHVQSVCLNLVSKVQPFLRTSSDVARLPGSLHHRHSLPLANVAVEITTLVCRPLPCRITGKHQHMHSSMCNHTCISVCFYMCMCLPDEEDMVTHNLFLGPIIAVPSAQFWNSTSVLSLQLQINTQTHLTNVPSWCPLLNKPVRRFSWTQLMLVWSPPASNTPPVSGPGLPFNTFCLNTSFTLAQVISGIISLFSSATNWHVTSSHFIYFNKLSHYYSTSPPILLWLWLSFCISQITLRKV